MSKKCINCGKKISFLEDSFTLPNQGKCFCTECSTIAKPLLSDIMTAVSDKSYEKAKQTFEEAMPQVALSDEAKKYIKYEFEDSILIVIDGKQYKITQIKEVRIYQSDLKKQRKKA